MSRVQEMTDTDFINQMSGMIPKGAMTHDIPSNTEKPTQQAKRATKIKPLSNTVERIRSLS